MSHEDTHENFQKEKKKSKLKEVDEREKKNVCIS